MLAFKNELWDKKKIDIFVILNAKGCTIAQKNLKTKINKTQEKIKDLVI